MYEPISTDRRQKPQINNIAAFAKDIQNAGYSVKYYINAPETLIPTQTEIDQQKVDDLTKKQSHLSGVIVSNDNFIIDGHHRCAAAKKRGTSIGCYRVTMPINNVYDFVKNKDYNDNKINEDVNVTSGIATPAAPIELKKRINDVVSNKFKKDIK